MKIAYQQEHISHSDGYLVGVGDPDFGVGGRYWSYGDISSSEDIMIVYMVIYHDLSLITDSDISLYQRRSNKRVISEISLGYQSDIELSAAVI